MSVMISNNFGSLEKELELAKTNLKDLDDSIKRIYGKSENFRSVKNFQIIKNNKFHYNAIF